MSVGDVPIKKVPRVRVLVIAAVGAVVLGTVAYAAIPGSGGVIEGCYDGGGNLKVVSALPCPNGYTPLQWNQRGPAGTNGVSGYERVFSSGFVHAGELEQVVQASVSCPAGKKVLGGGGSAFFGEGTYAHLVFSTADQQAGRSHLPSQIALSGTEQRFSTLLWRRTARSSIESADRRFVTASTLFSGSSSRSDGTLPVEPV